MPKGFTQITARIILQLSKIIPGLGGPGVHMYAKPIAINFKNIGNCINSDILRRWDL